MKLLVVNGLKKIFKVEKMFEETRQIIAAVDNVSFEVNAGKVAAIAGESGSGKTTLARCIAGLEDYEGEITFKGKRINFKDRETRRQVQYIFQDTYDSLNPRMNIKDIMAEPLSFHYGLKGGKLVNEIIKCLKDVGLKENVLNKYPYELSGGQRQRIVIARALTMKPELIIADEPVSSLDVSIQSQILKLFYDFNKNGMTIIFITHDLRIVKLIADEIMVMKQGKIVERGEVNDVYNKPETEYTKRLLEAIL
ncbi:MAG: ABC transporter ATP-binding protein [Candidatus Goldbacteria bacterium]|nr:ABC transporter ATP-binding protein [Candidatus Goldiibacteriota bacterium]HPD18609.1 ATP-binding cassette domain-containing protein [Candidatus Goldiibacteriota bacterium]